MHKIEQEEPSQSFKRAWKVAGSHIQNYGQGGVNWIRADLNPPIADLNKSWFTERTNQ